jgi:hypothetical protein
MKRLRTILPVAVLISGLVLTTVVSAQAVDPGSGNVNFTVMNLDTTESATVVASYIDQAGNVSSTRQATLDPLSSEGFPIDTSGLPDNWQGSVIVSGDREIVAFAQARWEGGNYGDGQTAGAYNGFTEGATKLYFPSLAARDSQFSRLSIQSAEAASTSETIDITIRFYDRSGGLSHTENDTLYKGTQETYDLLDLSLPVTTPPGDGWLGAAVVESDDPIAGVATTFWREYTGAYSGVTGGGLMAYLPSATRRLPSGPWYQYTSVEVQNLDDAATANVTVYWYDRTGALLYQFDDTIPANSSHGYNTRFTTSDVPNHTALHNALGSDWNGSVVVESDVDIVAVAKLQWTADSPVGTAGTSYTSDPAGYAQINVPANFRRVSSGTWRQFTGLVVQNVGTSACNNFSVEWRDRSGVLLLDYTDSLAPNISHGYNSRYGADIPSGNDPADLGDDFRGSVAIDAPGCELMAIHNTLWPLWTDSTTYNAFGQ